jgi:hypothetical protein
MKSEFDYLAKLYFAMELKNGWWISFL